ncbi:hypothetical protein PAESOLCIP111_05535 [Paenibacillus solanacearum]|uniref:Uncharacterized protein n=1 Tax=Paenibacillus solanacearum TaxID=2048548 RepID=A0A916K9G1_9BACL|nr:hypothetical protein [Paenibacillus solanacearum]CAG7648138.1 hypothetical protein PAESOLCIP111_05535 [Paenibacillus solanacearum]
MNEPTLMGKWDAEERMLMLQIQTYEACTLAVLGIDRISALHKLTVEDIVSNLHRITLDLQTELLHVRLEKAYAVH